MAAYVGLSQQINFARLPSPGERFDLRDLIGEGSILFAIIHCISLNQILCIEHLTSDLAIA